MTILSVVALLVVAIPSQLVLIPLGGVGQPVVLVGLACLVWWCYARLVPGSGLASGYQPVRIALGIFVGVALVSYVVALTTRFTLPNEVANADRALIFLAAFSGILLIGADGIDSLDRLRTLVRRVVLFAAVLAGFGLVQSYIGFNIGDYIRLPGFHESFVPGTELRSTFTRVNVTASHPIEFGVFMAMVWPLAVYQALVGDSTTEKRRAWVCVALISMGVAMSVSRSAIIGVAAAGIVLIIPWSWRRRFNAIIAVTVFTIATRLVVPGLVGTLRYLFTNYQSDTSFQARELRYPVGFELIHERPVFGRGYGSMLPENFFGVVPMDNQLLKSTIETGVVGLLALLMLFIVGVGTARGARRRSSDADGRELAQALAASVVATLACFYTFDALAYPKMIGMLAIVLGTVGALWRLSRAQSAAHG